MNMKKIHQLQRDRGQVSIDRDQLLMFMCDIMLVLIYQNRSWTVRKFNLLGIWIYY